MEEGTKDLEPPHQESLVCLADRRRPIMQFLKRADQAGPEANGCSMKLLRQYDYGYYMTNSQTEG